MALPAEAVRARPSPTPRAPDGRSARACEDQLLAWIRRQAVPFGSMTVQLRVDYQDGVPVMIRVTRQVEMEERFR